MPKVGKNTQFEDARRALAKAILDWHGDAVSGTEWGQKTPAKNPRDGYSCNAQKWTKTLREAAQHMQTMGYGMNAITVDDGNALLTKPLTESVRLLDKKVSSKRAKWLRFEL